MVEISLSVKQQCDQNKKRPKFPQIFATIVFTRIFLNCPMVIKNLRYFCDKLFANNFIISSNLVTLPASKLFFLNVRKMWHEFYSQIIKLNICLVDSFIDLVVISVTFAPFEGFKTIKIEWILYSLRNCVNSTWLDKYAA